MLLEGIHWHFKLFQGKGADSKAAVWHTIIAVRDANTCLLYTSDAADE